jgi:hypothetical protein
MLVRIRWFMLGALTAMGSGAWLLGRVVRLRERLTPSAVARTSGHAAADALDALATSIGGGSQ